ncbi:MAG: class I SAM-dependent methyltransferase [Desulfobacterales bacterium]|nr:class I SAM-dependent methyltransferase [Desulfobacterales bacterium]
MIFSNYFSKQARKPAGLYGRFYMSRVFEKGNAELNDFLFHILSAEPADHLLEIGFGTGTLIKRIAQTMDTGFVEGIDFSKTMVAAAQKKNCGFIRNKKVNLHLGDFNTADFPENRFDKVFTVNTIYFWENPDVAMSKISTILKPGGKLVIGFNEKKTMEKMPLNKTVFRYYSPRDVSDLFSSSGRFKEIEVRARQGEKNPCYCAVGIAF